MPNWEIKLNESWEKGELHMVPHSRHEEAASPNVSKYAMKGIGTMNAK